MEKPIRILLQTTIPFVEDDWSIERFSLLREHLLSLRDPRGRRVEVVARNREVDGDGDDVVLSRLDEHDFDEVWLFAVDDGNGLSARDSESITRFRQRGGGIFAGRDHEDLGWCLRTVAGIGAAYQFRARRASAAAADSAAEAPDESAPYWPHFQSGNNGDYQRITAVGPVHELLRNQSSTSGRIEYFPAHPHEGSVAAPLSETNARVIATSINQRTGRPFNLAVAFERSQDGEGHELGRAVAESSFHHLVDYNWDISRGCPSFVEEKPAGGIAREPQKLEHVRAYVRNLALWLAPER